MLAKTASGQLKRDLFKALAKAGIQYAAALVVSRSGAGYWIIRFRG
jgi:hypothetical protein